MSILFKVPEILKRFFFFNINSRIVYHEIKSRLHLNFSGRSFLKTDYNALVIVWVTHLEMHTTSNGRMADMSDGS